MATLRLPVARANQVNRSENVFTNLYLLKGAVSAEGQRVLKAANVYFGGLRGAMRYLNPMNATAKERILMPVNVAKLRQRNQLSLFDRALIMMHVDGQTMCCGRHGLSNLREVLSDVTNDNDEYILKILPTDVAYYHPVAVVRALALSSCGMLLSEDAMGYKDTPIFHGMADLLIFKMALPYLLSEAGGEVHVKAPDVTVEMMLTDLDLLGAMDLSYGTEVSSDQRFTSDQAHDGSRSINEFEDGRSTERQVIKLICCLLAYQLKLELDALKDMSADLKDTVHLTSFGAQLLKQASFFAPIDVELCKLMLEINDSNRAMSPATISAKWGEIRSSSDHDLTGFCVTMRGGNWVMSFLERVRLTVRPAKIA
ncbi:sigma-class non-structural protein [Broome reovirus]|uniref:Sigma-class non-structural protein n=1 Tax=Broome reovirus TaxID=667093 RepID=D6MM28_9REOV|nr:sigma NS [Broome reovirus]ACU68608.1 sigma-class non-structural protein [Broome reovirus]